MKRDEIMYGVRYVNDPGFIALFAYRTDALLHIAHTRRKGEPVRVVVTYDDGRKPPKRRKKE